jgi:ABC-2 type transport system permease protein
VANSLAKAPSLLALLLRVNALQAWRRLKTIRGQSRLLTTIVVVFIVGYLWVSFWLFYRGLNFLNGFFGLGTVLTERLLYLLFALLFVLLLLSNLIISYTNLFRNREAAFLLTLPVPRQTIFRWKFIESTLLASWAFVFLIAPLLTAFGLVRSVPWHFYVVTLVLVGLFIILPGVAGSWLAIQFARYLDRRSFQVGALCAAVAGLALLAFVWKTKPVSDEMFESRMLDVIDQLFVKTNFAQFAFLPSYWLSASVLNWIDGALLAAGFFMLVLLSHVSFFGFLAFTRLGNAFFESASEVQSRPSLYGRWDWLLFWRRRNVPAAWPPPDTAIEKISRLVWWLRPPARALLVKDARIFWRDTTQWGQSVMLFGLLGAYIINLRHFTQQLTSPFWINLVAYLNLAACSLNLATVTTRFVFPQFSLEGRRLWIIGMVPMGLARVVKAKYWFASFTSLAVTLSLMLTSSYLLKMHWDRVAFFGAVVTVMTFTLNGLAVGVGVLYPNFKETNPSKIVSGFGGTLCLVMSFLYILASVLLLAFGATTTRPDPLWVLASISAFTLLSFCIGWVPFKLGLRQLRQVEI